MATSGIPSGTAATVTAIPLATAWRRPRRRNSPSPVTSAPPVMLTGQAWLVSRLS
ncbi:Uncharacterised protein [Mycobacterium tuberculosis]|uniref:Uncharacterized protein n=1 Tax=Mycobacterium tuberculosis TaxID=1773 RepID=A0A0U0QM85_MYCTX|nr:Uncharacterised protein [Mycobacterium tuberculosis]COW15273.1 Uncharacterised protein [Mycobacterium tuberculosis]COY92992.1 Uncharacterised protein [Mycobacterium tuberculosis]